MKIFYDVDTQKDFMDKDGKLYVPDAESIKDNLMKLTIHAVRHKIPILGSVDRHFEDDKELEVFPEHCMNGTEGQKKIPESIFRFNISYVPSKIAPLGRYEEQSSNDIQIIMRNYRQIIFEKQTTDVFTNRNMDKYLDKMRVDEVILYGVATEYCVKDAVMGFLKRGIKVTIVGDAIKGINKVDSLKAMNEMIDAGVLLTNTDVITNEG